MIDVEYDGVYPSLCAGNLVLTIDGVRWVFPDYCMHSGGFVSFNEDYSEEYVDADEWSITDWPEGFPEDKKGMALEAVNASVSYGCCGGCI